MPNNAKSTARRYSINAKSIRHWKKVVHEVVPHARREAVTRDDIVKYFKKKTLHKGEATKMTAEQRTDLLNFFDNHRRTGMVVTVNMMTMELFRL